MKTVVVQIGNSDNKLTQQEWSTFCSAVHELIDRYTAGEIHFSGASNGWARWQNAAFIFETTLELIPDFRDELKVLRAEFHQESVALVINDVEFI